MKSLSCIFLFFIFGGVYASSEVSLDLTGCVDPEVNIERIDDNGKTLDIFDQVEARFRVTSNIDEKVKVTFKTQNEWRLLRRGKEGLLEGNSKVNSISYEGLFRGNNKYEIVNKDSDSIILEKSDFVEQEYEFGVIFRSTEKIKNIEAGKYFEHVTISVSSLN